MIVRAMKHSVKRVFPEIERTKKQRDILTALRIHVGVNMKRSGYNLFKILAHPSPSYFEQFFHFITAPCH